MYDYDVAEMKITQNEQKKGQIDNNTIDVIRVSIISVY